MILSVSERTDICAFYADWFYKRIEEGYVQVRNPFYKEQVSTILLDKDHVDAIIFCTKNPIPMMDRLHLLKDFAYQFQITITPYLRDIEPNVPSKGTIIQAVKKLSCQIGKERVVIRYDPILLNPVYTIDHHIKMFDKLCTMLEGYTEKIIISFVDLKKNTLKNSKELKLEEITDEKAYQLAKAFVAITKSHQMQILTCAEKYDFSELGFLKEGCTSNESLYQLTHVLKKYPRNTKRPLCNCLQTVDISAYNTCLHFCKYCYANYDEEMVRSHYAQHDPNSPLLIGHLHENDIIKIRKK